MKFVLNRPVETNEPTVVVDGNLAIGINRFQLEVIDESGNRSKPTRVDVLVSRSTVDRDLKRGFPPSAQPS